MSERTGITLLVSLPCAVNSTVESPSRRKSKFAFESSGSATLTIVRKPSRGISTQSDGSEFGSPDGNEQTLTSCGLSITPKSVITAVHSAEVSCGWSRPAGNGSVLVTSMSQVESNEMISVIGLVQRSTLSSPHE